MKKEVIDLNKKYDLKTASIISLSKLLLQKGIAFCCYRFPNSSAIHLAIQKGVVNFNNETEFIIAPFQEDSSVKKIMLQKISLENLSDQIVEIINAFPNVAMKWSLLPKEESKEKYLERIQNYLEEIRAQKISKAILSRVININKPEGFDASNFFLKLCESYPETFVSLFFIPEAGLWMGASPELLLEIKNDQYHTIALAATQPKSENKEYVWGEKEKEEHRLVQEHIESVFQQNNCTLISTNGPFSIESGKVAHLKTEYIFSTNSTLDSPQLLNQLHPTPAIGGLPVKEALHCIAQYEGHPRNYYAGYLGETNGKDLVRLYINLRCMQIGEEEIALFVGGGISADSNPENEWKETIQKSLTLLQIIDKPL